MSPQPRLAAARRRNAPGAAPQPPARAPQAAAATYVEARRAKLTSKSTRRLLGVPQDDVRNPFDVDDYKFPFPVLGCLCVQDSPENPCPCNTMVWLLERPVSVADSGRKTADGQAVVAFSLPRDAQVSLELLCPVDIIDLDRILDALRGKKPPGVAYAPWDKGWLGLAADAGYAVGGLLDDFLGSDEGGNDNLSDDVSDWLAENLPAPDFLKDIFDF